MENFIRRSSLCRGCRGFFSNRAMIPIFPIKLSFVMRPICKEGCNLTFRYFSQQSNPMNVAQFVDFVTRFSLNHQDMKCIEKPFTGKWRSCHFIDFDNIKTVKFTSLNEKPVWDCLSPFNNITLSENQHKLRLTDVWLTLQTFFTNRRLLHVFIKAHYFLVLVNIVKWSLIVSNAHDSHTLWNVM